MRRAETTLIFTTLLVLVFHALGSFFALYELLPWFDVVMHALGGAWLAALAVIFLTRYSPSSLPSARGLYVTRIVWVVLALGILWELYELGFAVYATATYGNLGFYQKWTDTASDLMLDAVGGAVTALLLFREERKVA